MDYDDNDFQSQNLHLAEGSNKFPPVLRPYALPKFEFDDNLHGPLRFDSLVETEVFLGIESNEDSQWIEDYSRGSTAIQFTSSAAESCCISRQNNVWSEATSSESVEMLLRSVGQEESVPVQSIAKKSNACDELGCMISQMEPSLNQDSNLPNRTVDFAGVKPTLSPCDIVEVFSGSPGDVGAQLPLAQDVSGGHEAGSCVDVGLGDFTVIGPAGGLSATVESPFIDSRCDSVGQSPVNTVVYESLAIRTQESDASGMHVDMVDTDNVSREEDENALNHMTNSSDDIKNIVAMDAVDPREERDALCEGDEIDQTQEISDAIVIEAGSGQLQNPVCSTPAEYESEANVSGSNLSNVEGSCNLTTDVALSENIKATDVSGGSESIPLVSVDGRTAEAKDGSNSVPQLQTDSFVTSSEAHLISEEENEASADRTERCKVSTAHGSDDSDLLAAKVSEGTPSFTAAETLQWRQRVAVPKDDEINICSLDTPVQQNTSSEHPSNDVTVNNEVHGSFTTDRDIGSLPIVGIEGKALGIESSVDAVGVNETAGSTDPSNSEASSSPAMGSALTAEESEKEILNSELRASEGTSVDPLAESEKDAGGASENMLSASTDGSSPMVDDCTHKDQIEAEAMDEDTRECTKAIEECSDPVISANKENDTSIIREAEEKTLSEAPESIAKVGLSDNDDSTQNATVKGRGEDIAVLYEGTNDKPDAVGSKNVESFATSAEPEKQLVASPIVATTEVSEVQPQREETKRSSHPSTSASSGDGNKSYSKRPNTDVPSKDDGSFTFQVPSFTESPRTENANKLQVVQTVDIVVPPFTESPQAENSKKFPFVQTVDTSKVPTPMDGSPSTSGLGLDVQIVQDLSHQSPKVSNITIQQSAPKVNSERKPRRSRATGKESAKRGRTAKATTPAKVERSNNANIPPGSPGLGQHVYSNEMQHFGHVDNSGVKPFVGTSMAGLPDLNSSATTTLFQQPFTDMQQVQLRAQIFVYGSLIQGTAPEEAYMISAFGGADGGKSAWEKNWRLCVERFNNQRSHLSTPETPVQSHSGVRAPEQTNKQSTPKGKAPGGKSSSKVTASTITSPMLPLSSPLWSVPTPSMDHLQSSSISRSPVLDFQRALSPLHPHQTPAMRNLMAHSPWISQGPFGAWITSPQTSAVETGSRFPVQMPHTEPVHLTPVKESSVSHTSAVKHVSTPLVSHAVPLGNAFPSSSMPDVGKAIISSSQQSTAPKPRRRKKSSAPENILDRGSHPETPIEIIPAAAVSSHLSTSVSITTPVTFVSKAPAEMLTAFPSPWTTNIRKEDPTVEQRANSSDEALGKVKEARAHAEDAAAFAATAVGQSQLVWSQLDKQRDASLSPDVEAKLASAAVAVAAAAAVAKAAAAAANVAANAALQARLMADEAAASGTYNGHSSLISFSNDAGNATPASMLKRDNGTSSSSSIIFAARETARKRVEAASAASKRAENMDAIIRAAELAAEAVSQAGKIIDMGDPLPLSQLVAAGPEGFWKVHEVSPPLVAKPNEVRAGNLSGEGGREIRDASVSHEKSSIAPAEMPSDEHIKLVDNTHAATGVKDAKGVQAFKPSETARTLEVVLEDGNRPKSPTNTENEHVEAVGSLEGSGIKEGSSVEILRDGNGFKAAWLSAKVLSLRDGMAYVSYDELTLGEGSDKLKEWVPLHGEGAEAPKIRISRPLTVMPFEGTRKRRRAAINDYNWSVGDRVDAWIRESWWEGVVTEKNKKDDTTLTVYFPVQGETAVVRAWHLRPSLLWKDGEWIEWSNSREENVPSYLRDTPQEKRARIRSPVVESKDKDKVPENANVNKEAAKPAEQTLLDLASEQKIFNIGKSTGNASRMARTGLQAEGSKVFGVPKPGKKRKFMEVSKHYVGGARGDKTGHESNDPSSKFPRWRGGTASRTDTTEKRPVMPKPRVPKPPVKASSNAQPQGSTASGDTTVAAFTNAKTKSSSVSGGDSSGAEKQNSIDFRAFSSSEETSRPPVVFSSVRQPDAVPPKKPSSVYARGERGSKGKLGTGVGKLGKVEEKKAFISASSVGQTSGAEAPRRSNRRIQPTSRLLEGLQSSLMVSKIPSLSHDKSHKIRPAPSPRGNNAG